MAVNTKVSVLATSTSVLTTQFRTCILTNYGTSGVIWVKIGQDWNAAVWEGIPLVPASIIGGIGGSISLDSNQMFQSPITAISSTWTNLLAVYYV